MATNSGGVLAALRAVLSSLWLCRVSVISVAAGLLLLLYAPQSQAVFFDLHTWEVGLRHWAVFYAFVFLFWMLPTQLAARLMLQVGEDRLPEGHEPSYAWLMAHLPWLLGVACLLAVAAGQYAALDHLPDAQGRDALEEAAYAQVIALGGVTAGLLAIWVLMWVAVRPLLNRATLGSGLVDNAVFRFIAGVLFGQRTARRHGQGDGPEAETGGRARYTPEQLHTAWAAVVLLIIWLASLYFVYLSPLEVAPALSRAPMLPVLVGIWVPVLTFLVYFAHRLRLPVLAAFIVLTALLSNIIPGLHDMRILTQAAHKAPLDVRQPSLEEALGWWRKANGCLPELKTPCAVRPIIVAAEGGASRAAFFTASLLAELEDLSDPAQRAGASAPLFSQQLFAISAVSGSSLGAAVFAALREDARGKGWPRPPPEAASNALWFRSGKAAGVGGIKPEPLPADGARRDAAQQILAGDFLTPAAAALNLDLLVPFHAKTYNAGDRTYFLERSWELRFANPSGAPARGAVQSSFERPLSSLAPEEGVWRPLLIFNGTSVTTGRRILTSTLYPLMRSPDDQEGTAEERRTVESVFRNAYDLYDLMCQPDGASLAGGACTCMRRGRRHEMQPVRIKGCDVRLSTAVSNSARFPVISSHGDIGSKPADRIVDGAYFDYSGLVSAMELHVQITRLDGNLRPFVLFLTNDPGFNPRACQAGGTQPIDELDVLRLPASPPPARDWELFSMLRYPIDTLINVRVARSEQTMAQTVLLNRYENVKAGFMTAPQKLADLREGLQAYMSFDIISVGARCNKEKQVRPIPMNWWLAMPTQSYLDQELCAPHNRGSIAGVLSQLGALPPADDRAQHAARYDAEKRRVEARCSKRDGAPVRTRQTK